MNREKRVGDTDSLIVQAQKEFRIRGMLSIVLWLFFTISVVEKLRFNRGFVTYILSLYGIEIGHYLFFSPGALGEIAKTIGVFSLFIVWIYAELGKHELGRQYTELLSVFCAHYHLRALSYILAILACIFIAMLDILESAGIAMMIAALGLWDQARILVSFIFNASVRKELAVRMWQDTFEGSRDSADEPAPLSELYILADNISINDNFFDKLCHSMAEGMLANLKRTDSSGHSVVKIIDMSYVWERMLDGRPEFERSTLVHNVLKHIDSIPQTDEADRKRRIMVCAGYLQQQIRHYTKMSSPDSDQEGIVLLHILSDISQFKHKQGNRRFDRNGTEPGVVHCLDTLFALLIWMHFLCNNIVLGWEFQTFLSNYECVYGDAYKAVFESFVQCTFDTRICDKYFGIAWKQVGKVSTDEGNIE